MAYLEVVTYSLEETEKLWEKIEHTENLAKIQARYLLSTGLEH